MKNSLKKKLSLLLVCVLFAAMTLTTGCGDNSKTISANANVNETIAGCEIGVGNTTFTFEVVDKEGNTTVFTVNTDAKTVGEALTGVNLIAGDASEYGLYVKTVNGITADWDVDQTYWAFYIDGEYAMTGVDATDIVAGSTYSFKVE